MSQRDGYGVFKNKKLNGVWKWIKETGRRDDIDYYILWILTDKQLFIPDIANDKFLEVAVHGHINYTV